MHKKLTPDQHRDRHVELHRALDELLADYMKHHREQPSFLDMPLVKLIAWSHDQMIEPTELDQ